MKDFVLALPLPDVERAKVLSSQEKSTSAIDSSSTSLVDGARREDGGESPSLTCRVCGIGYGLPGFESTSEQREHFRSDWHRYNLKRSIKNRPAVNEEEFAKTLEGDGEVSSISGSEESDNEEETGSFENQPYHHSGPQVALTTDKGESSFSVWRSLLVPDSNKTPSNSDLEEGFVDLLSVESWGVVLSKGGHFAGAIFERVPKEKLKKNQPVFTVKVHKTLHRYVIRAKAGGRQSTKDASGKYARSAGARLRRYNEMALERDVQDTLNSWQDSLKSADLIFYHTPSANAKAVFGGPSPPLSQSDPRVRNIPFQTRRPTFSETRRVSELLMRVFKASEKQEEEPGSVGEKLNGNEKDGDVNEIDEHQGVVDRVAKKEEVAGEGSGRLEEDTEISTEDILIQDSKLHVASSQGDVDQVSRLLESGESPCALNGRGQTPYQVAASKAVRNAFRRFMGQHPDKWDYSQSHIPSPLTEDLQAAQAAKRAGKKARQRARKKEQKAVEKVNDAVGKDDDEDDDEIARAIAEAELEAARLKGGRNASRRTGSQKVGKGKSGNSNQEKCSEEDVAARRERLAKAAEQRLAALKRASANQQLW